MPAPVLSNLRTWHRNPTSMNTRLLTRFAGLLLVASAASSAVATVARTQPSFDFQRDHDGRGSPVHLRVLKLRDHELIHAHRNAALEARMMEDFARSEGYVIDWVEVVQPEELHDGLITGKGDLAIGSLPPELAAESELLRTEPLDTERHLLVGRSESAIASPLELVGAKVAVPLSSPLWSYFQKLQKTIPGLQIEALPNAQSRDDLLRQVAEGVYDATVVPGAAADEDLADHPALRRLFDMTGDEAVSCYVPAGHVALLDRLNRFIQSFHTAYLEPLHAPRDSRAIQATKVLRVITRLDPLNYFLKDGKPAGFEFELAQQFAAERGLRIEVLVGKTDEEILGWLKSGAGDLLISRVDEARVDTDPALSRSIGYHYTAYVTVASANHPVRTPADMEGALVGAYEGSPEERALRSAAATIPGLHVLPVGNAVSVAQLLNRVAQGEVAATVVDEASAASILHDRADLTLGAAIPHRLSYHWTVRSDDPAFLEMVNGFLRNSYRDGLLATLAARYFDGQQPPLVPEEPRVLSPFDQIVQNYAQRYGFDWRLISAQIYQESQFDPRAISPTGARGLMQMLPSTAKALGFESLATPDAAIHAGVKYLWSLRNGFEVDLPASERTWFALAAYNTGVGRVEEARRLARKLELDPNRWFGNVEVAMQRMAKVRGDARCGQAIIYMQNVRSIYSTYRYLQVSALRAGSLPRA